MLNRFLALIAAAMLAAPLAAQEYRLGDITITRPWSRPTFVGPVGVGYLSIVNNGKVADALVGASSPAAASVQIHQSITVDNMARMRPLSAVEIAPGATVNIEPGGIHLMLMGLKAPLQAGQSVPLTLEFRTAGKITVELSVESRP